MTTHRTLWHVVMAGFLLGFAGCGGTSPYDEGWQLGCDKGGLDGSTWGCVAGYACDPTAAAFFLDLLTPPVDPDSEYGAGWVDGYQACFRAPFDTTHAECWTAGECR